MIDRAGIRGQLEEVLADLDKRDTAELARRGRLARALVHDALIPDELWNEVRTAYEDVEGAHRHAGICGQAPSDYPEIAAFLVGLGVDALSLNPDSVLATTVRLLELERGDGASRPRESGRNPVVHPSARV